MDIILFEDADVEKLAPLTSLRPAYTISCGGQTLLDVVQRYVPVIGAHVRPLLREFQRCEFPDIQAAEPAAQLDRPAWLLNARLVPRSDLLEVLQRKREHSGNSVFLHGAKLAAAYVNVGISLSELLHSLESRGAERPAVGDIHQLPEPLTLLEYPFDVIRHHPAVLSANLPLMIATAELEQVADGVYADRSFQLPNFWATDATEGPIVIQQHATVGPFTVLQGPLLVGPYAKIMEHSALKHGVAIGPYAKAGGEIECSILEAYSNKQHFGFLGHSYVGSWVNLGAGTNNSDLKNTYGTVRMTIGDQKLDSGMQFLGCIFGDYCKTAISTAIYSGKWLGACSMVYGTATENVPAFVNYLPAPANCTEIDPDVIVSMQQRMFLRRSKPQLPGHAQLIHDVFARTCHERAGLVRGAPRFS